MRTELHCISVFTSKAENFRKSADLGWLASTRRLCPRPAVLRISQAALGLRGCWSGQPARSGKRERVGDTQEQPPLPFRPSADSEVHCSSLKAPRQTMLKS